MISKIYVNVYEVDRNYGGPEEGGWWFDSGTPVLGRCRVFKNRAEAQVYADGEALAGFPKPRYPLYSVLYAGGAYRVRIENTPPKAFPTERPHYE